MTEEETFNRLKRPSINEMLAIIRNRGFRIIDFEYDINLDLLLIANNWTPDEFFGKLNE